MHQVALLCFIGQLKARMGPKLQMLLGNHEVGQFLFVCV
jgi:hypothetical protein